MALQLSDGLRNFLQARGAMAQAFKNAKLKLYSGSQPANGNAAPTGTLLVTMTNGSGANTPEVLAAGSVALTGGSSGNVSSVTVSGIEVLGKTVPFNTDLATTAADIATAINRNANAPVTAAVLSGSTVTLTAKPGNGAVTWAVVSTVATITKTDSNLSGGTTAVNGLRFGDVTAGTLVKDPTQVWSGVGVADGTAGWFRLESSVVDAGGLDADGVVIRLDGNIGTSGANLNLSSTGIATGATITITAFSPTEPAA